MSNLISYTKYFGLLESLAGRKIFYHGTSVDAAKDIKSNGLLHKHAQDPNNCTRTMRAKRNTKGMSGLRGKMTDYDGDYDDLVYLTTDKRVADFMKNHHERRGRKGETLRISVPYKVHRTYKVAPNPEFGLVEHIRDKDKLARHLFDKPYQELSQKEKSNIRSFLNMQKSNWILKNTDIDSSHIKGSDNYNKVTLKEILDYQKSKLKGFK